MLFYWSFLSEPHLADCSLISLSPLVPKLYLVSGQTKAFNPSHRLPRTFSLYNFTHSFICVQCLIQTYPLSIILTFQKSKRPQSTSSPSLLLSCSTDVAVRTIKSTPSLSVLEPDDSNQEEKDWTRPFRAERPGSSQLAVDLGRPGRLG